MQISSDPPNGGALAHLFTRDGAVQERAADQAQATPASSAEHFNANELLRIILKWKWLILGVLGAAIVASIVVTLVMTPVYLATTTLEINPSAGDVIGPQSEAQTQNRDPDQFLNTQYGLLRSRALAEEVARKLNLAADGRFVEGPTPAARQRAAAAKLAGNFHVEPQPGSDLVLLSYADTDPGRAALIANAFASAFIYSNLERRYDATAYARQFLRDRLNSIRAKLEDTERRLVAYAQRQGILELKPAGEGGGSSAGDSLAAQSLVSLNQALAQATTDRIIAEERYREAARAGATSQTRDDPTVQQLRTQRAVLQAEYDEKLATFKPDLPEMIALRSRMASLDANVGAQSTDVRATLRAATHEAEAREQSLRSRVNVLRGSVLDLRGRGIQYGILQRDADTYRALYDALLQRYKEIGVAGGVGESQASVVDSALRPGSSYRPNPLLNLGIGLALGLILGVGAALAIEFVDDTIKSPEDVIGKLRMPLLGLVPRLGKESSVAEELADQRSPIAESYFSVMTALQFSTTHGMPRTVVVTSSRSAEGKTSTSLAIAQNAARVGASVLLIDADLRKPSFKADAPEGLGLSALLTTDQPIDAHIVGTFMPNLSLLPAGRIPPNPAELLATGRIAALVREAVAAFDFVVIDAPPVLGLADAPILSALSEATIVVAESGVPRRAVLNSLRRLAEVKAKIAGVVLTKFDVRSGGYGYGYGYGYAYGYGERYGENQGSRPLVDMRA